MGGGTEGRKTQERTHVIGAIELPNGANEAVSVTGGTPDGCEIPDFLLDLRIRHGQIEAAARAHHLGAENCPPVVCTPTRAAPTASVPSISARTRSRNATTAGSMTTASEYSRTP